MIWVLGAIAVIVIVSAVRSPRNCMDSEFKKFEIEQAIKHMDREQAKACRRS